MKLFDDIITIASYLRQPGKRPLIRAAYQLKGKPGIEIGGPSAIFGLKGGFPVYLFAERVDGVNYSTETVWEGKIQQGETYKYYKNKVGYQYITEATDLSMVPAETYDFALSSHSLEHVANPIKALESWKKVLKKNALLVLVLPDKQNTGDFNRPYTSLEHLIEDFKANTDERDSTHFEEIIQCYDPSKDPGNKPESEIVELLNDNFVKRCAHHHVFSQEVVSDMLAYTGFSVVGQYQMAPFHLITLAIKN